MKQPTERQLCLSCHDGSASTYNIVSEYASGTGSSHPVDGGSLECTSCHTPHEGPAEGNPAAISVGGSPTKTGSEVCGQCHGTGSSLPGGDLAGPVDGTPHDLTGPSDSLAEIGCRACHEPHASSNTSLVRTKIKSGESTVTVSSTRAVCLACHAGSGVSYPGSSVAQQAKHFNTTTSTKALVTFPGAQGEAGGCTGCHEPHGTGTGASYTRLSGRALCEQCHDAAGLDYGTNYSYRGIAAFNSSGHTGATLSQRYVDLGPSSEGFAAWESTVAPTPVSPGVPVAADRFSALKAIDGSRLRTNLQTATGGYDYQMYRFKLPGNVSDITSATLTWAGYGEETAGYPVTLWVWNTSSNGWEQITSKMMATQQTISTTVSAANHADGSGYVYVRADARFVQDGQLVSGPTFTTVSATSVRVDWVTAGTSSSWVDYGSTASYGSTVGSSSRVTSHSVTVTGLATGVWHFRVRSVSPEGENYTSEDYSYALPSPTLAAPLPGNQTWTGTPLTATFYWNALSGPRGPYEYRVRVNGTLVTDWITSTSYVYTFNTWGGYEWQVEARDSFGVSHGWSETASFYVNDGTGGSCPFLFTWDGTGYKFEADMMMSGKLGNKVSTGYQKPNPQDAYTLSNLPEVIDGSWRFRMVEERFETDYIDQVQLFAADAPAGYTVLAEKPGVGGTVKEVAAQLHTVKDPVAPASAKRTDTGEDISAKLAEDDDDFVVLNEDRNNFTYKTIELDLGDVKSAAQVKLVIDGVSAFFQGPEGTANSAKFGPRTKVEVQKADGSWYLVPATELFMPVPPEFARTYVFDITKALQYGGPKVRLTFLYKTYIDMIKVDTTTDQPITLAEAPLKTADLRHHGLDEKNTVFEDVFDYIYGDGNDTKGFFPGSYTKYGEVSPLLTGKDDKFAIIGGGDEMQLDFEPLADPAAGLERSLIFASYGFYKDRKNDLTVAVEPLPFSAMSNYPYTTAEHYPDDAEHTAYRAEWNTRDEDSTVPTTLATSDFVWYDTHVSAWTSTEDTFSVDTDFLSVRLDNVNGSVANLSASAGWESTSTAAAPPTPSAPGAAVAAGTLANASADDGVNWRTNLATADRSWNWQVARFNLGAGVERTVRSVMVNWNGHGEPTPGYNTAVYIWDFGTSSWRLLKKADMPADQTVITSEQAVSQAFCFRCHDGTPPAGVTFPAGSRNVGASWTASDFHGGGSGAGFGSAGLRQPYVRSQGAIPCSTCHETHGSASLYHFPSSVNGTALAPITTGPAVLNACGSCHAGTANQWHQSCVDCHSSPDGHSTAYLDFTSGYDCVSCHKHNATWTHPDGCHCGPGGATWKTF